LESDSIVVILKWGLRDVLRVVESVEMRFALLRRVEKG
jgi:hypothetical protein